MKRTSPLQWRVASCLGVVTLLLQTASPVYAAPPAGGETATPIKHFIVIIGENRTFDHVFATYKPIHGESVSNLLSKGIVKEDGTPGKNFALGAQSSAVDHETYKMSPPKNPRSLNPLPPTFPRTSILP